MNPAAQTIGRLALTALEKEARLTPKPGLVDAENSGAHADMNLALLLLSAETLAPYFEQFAVRGIEEAAENPDGRLGAIRESGIEAENAMFQATNGVNTHKGALFLLGALCYACGHCAGNGLALLPQTVCAVAGRICAGVTRELGADAGRAYARYGAAGARGEAEAGFPNALAARAAYLFACERGAGEDDGWLLALLSVIEHLEDANVLSRCGEATANQLKARAREIVRQNPAGGDAMRRELRALDHDCIHWRASPGGAADILACAMFLQALAELRPVASQL